MESSVMTWETADAHASSEDDINLNSTEQPLAPDEPLAVCAHGTLERHPGDPDTKEKREREQGPLQQYISYGQTAT